VLLWTIWLKSLLIPMKYVTLILMPLSEPVVPASIPIAAKASSLSPFIIPPSAIIWLSPEVRVEPMTIERCAIVYLLIHKAGDVSM